MDRELAQMVISAAFRARVELGHLAPILKKHGEAEKDEAIKSAIGSAVYEIGLVADRAFEQYPALEAEYEARLKKYGRSCY